MADVSCRDTQAGGRLFVSSLRPRSQRRIGKTLATSLAAAPRPTIGSTVQRDDFVHPATMTNNTVVPGDDAKILSAAVRNTKRRCVLRCFSEITQQTYTRPISEHNGNNRQDKLRATIFVSPRHRELLPNAGFYWTGGVSDLLLRSAECPSPGAFDYSLNRTHPFPRALFLLRVPVWKVDYVFDRL